MYTYNPSRQNFYPKKPLRSFQDLEVYQKTLEASVLVAKNVDAFLAASQTAAEIAHATPAKSQKGHKGTRSVASTSSNIGSGSVQSRQGTDAKRPVSIIGTGTFIEELIVKNMLPCALGIPHQVAEAHSLRFGDHTAAIVAIEKAMLNCNKIIVYLEQFRDICNTGIDWEVFDDLIKKYLYVRRKMLNLERSWKKYMPGYRKEE